MTSRSRLVSFVALVVLLLIVPGTGLAGNPASDPYTRAPSGTRVKPRVVLPPFAIVPGATVLNVGFGDSTAFDQGPGATLIWQGGIFSTYASTGTGYITASPRLPAGSTLWQVDMFGLVSGATTQDFGLDITNGATGAFTPAGFTTTPVGPGVVQVTMPFPSGITLAPGESWLSTDFSATSIDSAFIGAIFQYTLPTASLVAITPVRVYDTRFFQFGGAIGTGTHRTINVKDALDPITGAVTLTDAIPVGARAVSFNVTVTHTLGAGYLALIPGADTTVTASTLNWTGPGQTVANGGLISLGSGSAERQITIVIAGTPGSSAQVVVDITGYYQ
jgi:hypothetical protein